MKIAGILVLLLGICFSPCTKAQTKIRSNQINLGDSFPFTGPNTASQLNNIVYVDGVKYACSSVGILAAEAVVAAYGNTGGIVDVSVCNSFTVPIATTVDVGCISGDTGCSSTYAVNLRLNSRTIWQGTMTNSTLVFRVHSNSSISCPGVHGGDFCAIDIAPGATVSSIVQQGDGTHISTGVKTGRHRDSQRPAWNGQHGRARPRRGIRQPLQSRS